MKKEQLTIEEMSHEIARAYDELVDAIFAFIKPITTPIMNVLLKLCKVIGFGGD